MRFRGRGSRRRDLLVNGPGGCERAVRGSVTSRLPCMPSVTLGGGGVVHLGTRTLALARRLRALLAGAPAPSPLKGPCHGPGPELPRWAASGWACGPGSDSESGLNFDLSPRAKWPPSRAFASSLVESQTRRGPRTSGNGRSPAQAARKKPTGTVASRRCTSRTGWPLLAGR